MDARARATTALGGYFKPFRHEISGNTFSNQDNPMDIITVTSQEWRFIWQDLPLEHPDIVLSLGTGCRADDGLPERKRSKATRNKLTKTFRSTQKAQKAISQQELWDSYISQLSDFATHRFWRLDPEFDHDLPGIDDVTKLRAFRQQLQKHAAVQLQIPRLAAQLVASLFYFELSEPISKTETNEFIAKGKSMTIINKILSNS